MKRGEAEKTKMLFEVYLDLAYAVDYAEARVEEVKEELKLSKKTLSKSKKSLAKIITTHTKLTGKPPISHRK